MKQLPDGCVDAVITDPPYGIEIAQHETIGAAQKSKVNRYQVSSWDDVAFTAEQFADIVRISGEQIVFGWNYYPSIFPPNSSVIVWDKKLQNGWVDTYSDCELAWCSLNQPARMFRHLWLGACRASETGAGEGKQHPAQKPIEVMAWCIGQLQDAQTIIDPFSGSGSTLVAAKKLGRHFLGFEISEAYCQIARERLARIDAQPNLFASQPEQLALA